MSFIIFLESKFSYKNFFVLWYSCVVYLKTDNMFYSASLSLIAKSSYLSLSNQIRYKLHGSKTDLYSTDNAVYLIIFIWWDIFYIKQWLDLLYYNFILLKAYSKAYIYRINSTLCLFKWSSITRIYYTILFYLNLSIIIIL